MDLIIILLFIVESEDLYQIAVLIDQLKHEDLQLRVSAFKSIELIGIWTLSPLST